MLKFGKLSFKWKLTLITMVTCVVSLLAGCAAFVWYDNYLFKQAMTRELEADASFISRTSASALLANNPLAVKKALEPIQAKDHVVAGAIYSQDGKEIVEKYLKPPGTESLPK